MKGEWLASFTCLIQLTWQKANLLDISCPFPPCLLICNIKKAGNRIIGWGTRLPKATPHLPPPPQNKTNTHMGRALLFLCCSNVYIRIHPIHTAKEGKKSKSQLLLII